MQSDQQAALGYLKEQFGEGWDCALWSEDGIGVDDRWQARAIHGIVEVRTFREPDPMSAARACVEARDAAFPQKPERWYSEQTMAAVAKERDELRTDADRLAEALRWYADPETWEQVDLLGRSPLTHDRDDEGLLGMRARAALKGGGR